MECSHTRVLPDWKPIAYKQCMATGTLTNTAIRPDHRCRPLAQAGARRAGRATSAEVANWITPKNPATLANQALT